MDFIIENEETFTQNSLAGPVKAKVVRIKGWEGFTDEEKEACMVELCRRRDAARSKPVDPCTLGEKLRQLEAHEQEFPHSRRSSTSSLSGSIQWVDEEFNYEKERESYHTLLNNGGIPFQSFERHSEALQDQVIKNLMDYWNSVADNGRMLTAQSAEWERFRQFQQRVRRRKDWQNYLGEAQDRRQKYRIERYVALDQDRDAQDQLTTWLEYQEYRHRIQEHLQNLYDADNETLAATLAEVGEDSIPEYHEFSTRNDFVPYGLVLLWQNEEYEAKFAVKLAKKKLAFMRDRLSRAYSYREDPIKKPGWFLREVVNLREKVQTSQQCYERAIEDEHFYYVEELERAEKGLEIARLDLHGTIDKSDLVSKLEQEVELNLSGLEEKKAHRRRLQLRCRFINVWSKKLKSEGAVKRHRFLLDWIERQRFLLVSNSQDSSYGRKGKLIGIDENGQRALRSRATLKQKFACEASQADDSKKPRTNARSEHGRIPIQRVLRPRSTLKRPLEPHVMIDASPAKKQKVADKVTPKMASFMKQLKPKPNGRAPRQLRDKNTQTLPNSTKRHRQEHRGKPLYSKSLKKQKTKISLRASDARTEDKTVEASLKRRASQNTVTPASIPHNRLRRSARIATDVSTLLYSR